MENPFKQIVRFNKEAGLLDRPFDPVLENRHLIEEALEGFDLDLVARKQTGYITGDKITAQSLAAWLLSGQTGESITEAELLDKACDAVVFAVGTMAKLGLNHAQITRALNTVMQANLTKLKDPVMGSDGKLGKSGDFVGPETKLQEILDSRV